MWGLGVSPGLRRLMGVKPGAEEKELVRHVNLSVEPGEFCAIIGGSGSGKTSLLNAITCRPSMLKTVSGDVSFLGSSGRILGTAAPRGVKDVVGYVRQDDYLLPYLTVRETITFAAALRLPAGVDMQTQREIVDQTLVELGLMDAAETVVGGGPLSRGGISGGEKRRLTIACVLVSLPSVLICDEVTTGLDAFSSFQLLTTLSRLAKKGRTVLISIHQPRSDAFALFDKVTLLSSGSVIYSGHTSSLIPHFQAQGFIKPPHVNPLDWVIDVSSLDTRTDAAEGVTAERVARLVRAWKQRENNEGLGALNEKRSEVGDAQPGKSGHRQWDLERGPVSPPLQESSALESTRDDDLEQRIGWSRQTEILSHRAWLNVSRNHGQNVGFFLQAVVIGICLGMAFYMPPETPAGIQSLKTIIYQSTPAFFCKFLSPSKWRESDKSLMLLRSPS